MENGCKKRVRVSQENEDRIVVMRTMSYLFLGKRQFRIRTQGGACTGVWGWETLLVSVVLQATERTDAQPHTCKFFACLSPVPKCVSVM